MKQFLLSKFNPIIDLGTKSSESCDYPIFAQKLSKQILEVPNSYGILICGTGIGMSVAANRIRGIRAALCVNKAMAKMARRHNDANIIVFGAQMISNIIAESCVRSFLETDFESGRHLKRLNLIDGVLK